MLLTLTLLAPLALADTLSLDTGVELEGDLVRYEQQGTCEIALRGGGLDGATLTLPCARLTRFDRDPNDFAPVSQTLVLEEDLLAAVAEPIDATPLAAAPAVEAPPVEAPLVETPVLLPPLAVAPPAPAPVEVPAPLREGRVPSPPRAPTVREAPTSAVW